VRRNMEKEYGRGWNCIVGTSFGAYVTHEIKTYVYFSVAANVSVLVWRT
jgi:dynein light chain LC8-type